MVLADEQTSSCTPVEHHLELILAGVPSNFPKDAHVFAGWGNLRYVLPWDLAVAGSRHMAQSISTIHVPMPVLRKLAVS
jgi:hypothetical protein